MTLLHSLPVELRAVEDVADLADAVYMELADEIGALAPGVSVDHVGATALPSGLTKGDIDVALSVPNERFADVVAALGQRYDVAQPENWTATYASFSAAGKPLPVGIQVAVAGSEDDFLVPLRDLMLSRPDLLAAYTENKRAAATLGAQGYWEAKDRFLRAVFVAHLPWARPARRSN